MHKFHILSEVPLKKYYGSCLCQQVKYELTGTIEAFFLCHCSRCRKVTGSAHASNLFVSSEDFRFVAGENLVKEYFVEGTRFGKAFCSICSSAMPRMHPFGKVLVPAGGLDCEITVKPMGHIQCESRAGWDDGFVEVPKFDRYPPP